MLINTKNADKNKEYVEEIKNRISSLENRIEEMNEKEKKDKIVDETLEIIKKVIDYNKDAQNLFHCASKVDKKNQNQRLKKSIKERVKFSLKHLNRKI